MPYPQEICYYDEPVKLNYLEIEVGDVIEIAMHFGNKQQFCIENINYDYRDDPEYIKVLGHYVREAEDNPEFQESWFIYKDEDVKAAVVIGKHYEYC